MKCVFRATMGLFNESNLCAEIVFVIEGEKENSINEISISRNCNSPSSQLKIGMQKHFLESVDNIERFMNFYRFSMSRN